MSIYIRPKRELTSNEIEFKCPHCKSELIEVIEKYADDNPKTTRNACPKCYKHI